MIITVTTVVNEITPSEDIQVEVLEISVSDIVESDPIFQASEAYLFETGDKAKLDATASQTDLSTGLALKVDKVADKQLSTEDFTTTEKNKLASITEIFTTALKTAYDAAVAWIATNGQNLIDHLSNESNPHSVTKTQVGLGNADNTSDTNKPISTATQTALDLKADLSTLSAHTSSISNPHSVTKSQVGLSNVDNTSDANKPVSTATQTALDLKENLASKSTITTLGTSDTLYPTQNAVKSYVDSKIVVSSSAPSNPSNGQLWFDTTDTMLWRWDTSVNSPTGAWISETLFRSTPIAINIAITNPVVWNPIKVMQAVDYDRLLVDLVGNVRIATTNNGSNYWNFQLSRRADDNTNTNITGGNFDTSANSANTWLSKSSAISVANGFFDVSATNVYAFLLTTSQTGAPGSLSGNVYFNYRLVKP